MRFCAWIGGRKKGNSKNLTCFPGLSPLLTFLSALQKHIDLSLFAKESPASCRHLAAVTSLPNKGADLQQLSLPDKGRRDSVLSCYVCVGAGGSGCSPPQAALSAQPGAAMGPHWPGALASCQLIHVKSCGEYVHFLLLESQRCSWG